MTQKQDQIIIGSILGDGCLEKNGTNHRLRFFHSPKQIEYLFWKYNSLIDLTISRPKTSFTALQKKTKKRYLTCHFSTLTLKELNCYRELFYQNKKKIVPLKIKKLLTPLALAVWYMDDGYKRNDCSALRINSDSFTLNEQQILKNALEENFNIEVHIHKKGKYFNLYIPSKYSQKFSKIVCPYIVPSMRYKLALTP